jgi:hypothetical protein
VKPEFLPLSDADCSCLQIEVLVEEAWINHFLGKQDLVIHVSEKYSLSNLRIEFGEGKLTLDADITEKEGSSISVICLPKWDETQQRIHLEELEIKTHTKNILVKSAGWFATTFMGSKIDKKIEEATNQLYSNQMEKILAEGITIPIANSGSASVRVRSVVINEMVFVDHSIKVKAMIDGYWKLHLKTQSII